MDSPLLSSIRRTMPLYDPPRWILGAISTGAVGSRPGRSTGPERLDAPSDLLRGDPERLAPHSGPYQPGVPIGPDQILLGPSLAVLPVPWCHSAHRRAPGGAAIYASTASGAPKPRRSSWRGRVGVPCPAGDPTKRYMESPSGPAHGKARDGVAIQADVKERERV